MPRGAERAARRPNRTEFSEQKEIPDSVKSRKEKFFKILIQKTMRYIIYARKSTEEDNRQVLSIEAQLVELKEFAAKEKLEIVSGAAEPRFRNFAGGFHRPARAGRKPSELFQE